MYQGVFTSSSTYALTISLAIGSVVGFESSCTSLSLALSNFSYSSSRSLSKSSTVNVSPAFTLVSLSASLSFPPLCSHSHRMLNLISPVAASSIRYRMSSLPKKSAGFSAAAWKPWPKAFPYWRATLIKLRAPLIDLGASSRSVRPSASSSVYVNGGNFLPSWLTSPAFSQTGLIICTIFQWATHFPLAPSFCSLTAPA